MKKRNGRRVHVTFIDHYVKITLAWFEPRSDTDRGFKVIDLRYGGSAEMRNAEKALDILVPNWSKVFVSEYHNAIISCELDKDPELYDQITNDPNPETFFISSNTLNYCDGKSASMRLWEIEFNERYAKLIEFNKQAQAQA